MEDLKELPKLKDSLSYLYCQRAVIKKSKKAIAVYDAEMEYHVPAASLSALFLGPGTSISHDAVKVLAKSGCSIIWTGGGLGRFYASGTGETRKGKHLLKQAKLASFPETRLKVVRRMYDMRFAEKLDSKLSIPQIRGMEGSRVRAKYFEMAKLYQIEWHGRRYNRGNWNDSDRPNKALSSVNALLHGICHNAIVAGGYSTAIGFLHTGKQLSFVYDIADLYKTEISIPAAFKAASLDEDEKVEKVARRIFRQMCHEKRLLKRILPDIDTLFDIDHDYDEPAGDIDSDPALPTKLWTPEE